MSAPDLERQRNFGFLISGIYRFYVRLFERHSEELGLNLAQCRVLAFLTRNEGASQARIAERCEMDPMTLVRILDRMEQDGWIERRPNPEDRRAHRLFLLEAARPMLESMWRTSDAARGQALEELSALERVQFLALLERVHSKLAAIDAVAGAGPPDSAAAPTGDKTGRRTPART